MGIGFSHGEAQWAYSGFTHFRKLVAEEISLDLYTMEGYFTDEERRKILDEPFLLQKRSWDEIDDPLVPFFIASDVRGLLTPEECRVIAPRLRELIKDWPDTMKAVATDPEKAVAMGYKAEMEYPSHDKANGYLLIEGMEQAAEAGENFTLG